MVVDLPAPFGPRNPRISPGSTSSSRSNTPRPSPKSLESPRISITLETRVLPWAVVVIPSPLAMRAQLYRKPDTVWRRSP
jgi:hypothetical protein